MWGKWMRRHLPLNIEDGPFSMADYAKAKKSANLEKLWPR